MSFSAVFRDVDSFVLQRLVPHLGGGHASLRLKTLNKVVDKRDCLVPTYT